jgi:hypothetical protein
VIVKQSRRRGGAGAEEIMSRFAKRSSKSSNSTARPIEELEGRQMFTVVPSVPAAGVLVFTGDAANDQVNIYDNGAGMIAGNYTNAGGGLTGFGWIGGFQTIYVNTGAGDDAFTYQIIADNLAGGARYVRANLGDGDDVSRFYAGNDIDLGPNAYYDINVYGGAGKDYIGAFYQGELDGQLRLIQSGVAGDDTLSIDAKLDFGSSGLFFARQYGGDGDDTMTLTPRKAFFFDPVVVDAGADGGPHIAGDRLTRTPLAADINIEFLTVVP